ncbi:MAG: hypothetical protein IJU39_06380 [Clostridia bacterium]|nr:hypothetical protein [Clostridia bacterium]
MTIKKLISAVLSNLIIIVVVSLVFGIIGGYINYSVIHPKYTAYSTFYVLDTKNQQTEGDSSTTYSDLRISDLLVADYNVLATSKRVKDKVAANIGINSLAGYKVSISSSDDTRVMKMTVIGEDREMTARIANEMVSVFKETVIDIMNVENVNVVDYAEVPKNPSSPAKLKNTIFCLAVGFAVSTGVVILLELLDNTVKSPEEVEELFELPILANIGRLRGTSGGKYDSYDSYKESGSGDKGKKGTEKK